MYLTHSPISPQVQSTPDLYFREKIRNLRLQSPRKSHSNNFDRGVASNPGEYEEVTKTKQQICKTGITVATTRP